MSRNALIVFVSFFLYVSSPPGEVNAKAVKLPTAQNPPISILDAMTTDAELCIAGKPLSESSFAKVCKNFEYPKDNVTLKSSDSEQFMCLGLYDRIYRLCYLDTLKTDKKSVLPDTAAQFDQQVTELLPKNGEAILEFCKTWTNDYPPKYNKTEQFIKQLEKVIREPALCVKHCTADDASVVPLCVVLKTIDDMSEATAKGVQSLGTSQKKDGSDAQTTMLETQQSQAAVDQGSSGANVNIDSTIGAAQSHQTSGMERTAASTDNHGAKLPQEKENDGKPDQTATSGSEKKPEAAKVIGSAADGSALAQHADGGASGKPTGEAASGKPAGEAASGKPAGEAASGKPAGEAASGKPADGAASGKPAGEAASGKPAEGAASGKPADGAASGKPANGAGSGKPGDGAAPAESADGTGLGEGADGTQDDQHEVVSGEDISGEEGGGIFDGGKLSEHTQDDPETEFAGAGGDPAAVEPPVPIDEDVGQSAVQPSDKREYVPHIPTPNEDESHFFSYLTVIGVMCIAGYVGYHNKQKILAMVLEGRRSRGGRSRRRPSTANYRKLDCTLEEAVTSQCNSNVTHVIY